MISIEHAPELDTLPISTDAIHRLLTQVIAEQSEQSVKALTIVFGTHTLVRSLNVQYLDHDYNTDVLAFNLSDAQDELEGEVYVDVETARERHGEFDTSVDAEIARYAVHGVLHLLGHTDKTEEGQAAMRQLEDQYVQGFTNTADTPPA